MSKTTFVYPNIKLEQFKMQLTNAEVAQKIGISRVSYESKLKSGRFVASEVLKMCELFDCDTKYLFASNQN